MQKLWNAQTVLSLYGMFECSCCELLLLLLLKMSYGLFFMWKAVEEQF